MKEKYIKFYQSFHKAFQGKKSNHCLETLSDSGIVLLGVVIQVSITGRALREAVQ